MPERSVTNTVSGNPVDIMLTLELVLEYPDDKTAKVVFDSVHPDNGAYVGSELRGNKIIFNTKAENAGTMKNTADDLLACVKVAESSVVIASGTDLDGDSLLE